MGHGLTHALLYDWTVKYVTERSLELCSGIDLVAVALAGRFKHARAMSRI
jgi:tRNA1(Val) A37 N6-methylase TrmN6